MKIIVLGAGAIGSFYGTKLSKINDVTLVARKGHADKINKYGLKISGLECNVYRIKAVTEIRNIEKNTVILLTTKVYDSKKTISSIKRFIRNDTIIICLQNGLYSENIVKKIIDKKCLVLRAITNFGVIFLKPGCVAYKNYSYTSIEKSNVSKEIAENFTKCGLNGYVSGNIKKDMWKKLIINCVLNPVTAILKMENKGISDKRLNPLKKLIADECLEVAEKDGVKFGVDFVGIINKEFAPSQNISSMQQDLLKGKQTEIDYLNGGIAELGKKYGIECPANEALTRIIKKLENQ